MRKDFVAFLLDLAHDDLGKGEVSGQNDGPWIESILREKARRNWCAAWVLTKFDEAGHPLPGNFFKNRAVSELERNLRSAGAQFPADEARPGDIITFNRAGGGHVGIVVSVPPGHLTFRSLEGNVNNRVSLVHHFFGEKDIRCAYRWPIDEVFNADSEP